jgi:hypothetical protein
MHPPLNNRIQQLPPSPPPDDMPVDFNGENNPGPHEAAQGDAQTVISHPILDGMSFSIRTFVLFQRLLY